MAVALSATEYQALVEQAPIMIWRANTTAECDYFNHRWLDFRGRTMEQEIGNQWAEGVHPEDLAGCLHTYTGSFERREIFEMHYRLKRVDGAYRWIFDRGVPFYNADGSFLGYIGSCIDVTERIEAHARRELVEEDLRQQKEILQTIFDHVPVILKFVDKEGRVQMLNREWERLLGRALDEIVNQGVDIYEEGYPDPLERQRILDFVANSNTEWMDFKTRVKDGRVIDTSWAVVRLSDGASICIGQDISERKQAEHELRQQKEILQTIFDHIPVMVSFVDRNNRVKLVNREWERTLGWSLEEILGHGISVIVAENYPDPEYRKQVVDFILNSDAEWADFKTTVRDGRVIDTSWAILHLSDGTGIGIGQDITKRKRAEEALKESEERFRQLAENINDLFWIKTSDFKRVLYLSPIYKSLTGRSPEERYQDEDYQPSSTGLFPKIASEWRRSCGAEPERSLTLSSVSRYPTGRSTGFAIEDFLFGMGPGRSIVLPVSHTILPNVS